MMKLFLSPPRILLFVVFAFFSFSQTIFAVDAYPSKAIKLIIPFEAGGTSDVTGRKVAQKLEARLNGKIVVENKIGANGEIASALVAKSPGDGYTLMHTTPAFIINPLINKNLSYDVFKDFVPITNIGTGTGYVLVVNPNLPVKNVQELIAYAKSNGKGLVYSSPGIGNATHLAAAQFVDRAGIVALHIPYKGTAPALTAVASGDADFMIMPPTVVHGFIKSGKVRALAFTGSNRSPDFSAVPTLQESGLGDLVIAGTWLGWFAPSGTPQTVIDQIAREIKVVLQDPEMVSFLATSGFKPDGRSPAEFDKFVRAESNRIAGVLKNTRLSD